MKRNVPEQTNGDTGTRGERHAFGLAGAAPPGAEKPQRPRNGRAGQETGRPEPPFDLSALRDDPGLDENRALLECGEPPSRAGERFSHQQEDAAYGAYAPREDSE